ncbi:hypothetical protein H4K36_13180 [Streptomyces sp. DHE7-1]|nr:hypothetical protein [Streptomyces sp. DHE7-1]
MEWAQAQAREAVAKYREGKSASDEHRQKVQTYNAAVELGLKDPGPKPSEQDPGTRPSTRPSGSCPTPAASAPSPPRRPPTVSRPPCGTLRTSRRP